MVRFIWRGGEVARGAAEVPDEGAIMRRAAVGKRDSGAMVRRATAVRICAGAARWLGERRKYRTDMKCEGFDKCRQRT